MSEPTTSSPVFKGWMNRTVAGAGITSALGDFCYETITVMPRIPGCAGHSSGCARAHRSTVLDARPVLLTVLPVFVGYLIVAALLARGLT